jgi:hypothetical protein
MWYYQKLALYNTNCKPLVSSKATDSLDFALIIGLMT